MKIATADKNLNLEVFFIKTMPSFTILRKKEKAGELKKTQTKRMKYKTQLTAEAVWVFFIFREKKNLYYIRTLI